SATAVTRRRAVSITSAAVIAGTPTTPCASNSRLVTQSPQCCAVACSELREDPLVEHTGDQRDEHEIERDAELDRERGAAGQLERRQRKRVLDEDDAQDLEEGRPPRGDRGDAERDEGE